MTRKEFEEKRQNYRNEKKAIDHKISILEKQYGIEVLERNGYKIGDIVEYKGDKCMIVGTSECVYIKAELAKLNKDGHPSLRTFTAYDLYLKEE